MKNQDALLRLQQIIGNPKANPPVDPIIPVSRSTWLLGVREGRFPQPVRLGRCLAWKRSSIMRLVDGGGDQ